MRESRPHPRRRNPADPGLIAALNAAGTGSALAEAVGVTVSRVSQWTRVPYQHVLTIERVFRVPRSTIRPDVYPPGEAGKDVGVAA